MSINYDISKEEAEKEFNKMARSLGMYVKRFSPNLSDESLDFILSLFDKGDRYWFEIYWCTDTTNSIDIYDASSDYYERIYNGRLYRNTRIIFRREQDITKIITLVKEGLRKILDDKFNGGFYQVKSAEDSLNDFDQINFDELE